MQLKASNKKILERSALLHQTSKFGCFRRDEYRKNYQRLRYAILHIGRI